MDDMRHFTIEIGGMMYSAAEFPDMPEDVREYLIELHDQIAETGESGITAMGDKQIPEFVNKYVEKAVQNRVREMMKDKTSEKVKRYSIQNAAREMDIRIAMIREKVETEVKRKPDPQEMNRIEVYLRALYRKLCLSDEDWRELPVRQAERLYSGVVIEMFTFASDNIAEKMKKLSEREIAAIFGGINLSANEEDGRHEEA